MQSSTPSSSSSSSQFGQEESLRKQRHNEVEIRRRSRLNDCIQQIRKFVKTRKTDKNSILIETISKLESLMRECSDLQVANACMEQEIVNLHQAQCFQQPEQEQHQHQPHHMHSSHTFDSNSLSQSTSSRLPPVDFYQCMMDAGVAIALARMDGSFLDCNVLFSDSFGFDKEAFVSQQTLFSVTPPADMGELYNMVGTLLSGSQDVYWSSRNLLHSSGSTFHSTMAVKLARDSQNVPLYLVFILLPSSPSDAPAAPEEGTDRPLIASTLHDLESHGAFVVRDGSALDEFFTF